MIFIGCNFESRVSQVGLHHQYSQLLCQQTKDLGPDYMANFSPASETNPLKIKLSITWRGIQPRAQFSPAENPSPVYSNRARIFNPGKRAEKS